MSEHRFLAMDLGAESGRCELVTLRDGTVSMEELRRWPNRPVRLGRTLYWDFPFLFGEILASLKTAAERGSACEGVSVDTWGVDFGLLGADGSLLGNPVHYRDARTEGIGPYAEARMPATEIFNLTGYDPAFLNSLYQLLAMQRDGSPLLGVAQSLLNMPDLFNYFLSGVAAGEMSILNTSDLLASGGGWAEQVIERFGLPRRLFGRIVAPATVLGPLAPHVADQTGLGGLPVVATCGHDTSAAVAAVPARGENWAFLSCGTWSILGCLVERPIVTPQCRELGFINEYTIGGWYLARNILGLWLVQELRRKWDRPGDKWDYARLTAEAAASHGSPCVVDVSHPSLLAPSDMEAALMALIARSGQPSPSGRGGLVRCVLESLALEYAMRLDGIEKLTGRRPDTIFMVGGGIRNELLCQLTASACGVAVHAAADQCTALGNALGQAYALGILKDRQDIRDVMRNSHRAAVYGPRDQRQWADKRGQYARLVST